LNRMSTLLRRKTAVHAWSIGRAIRCSSLGRMLVPAIRPTSKKTDCDESRIFDDEPRLAREGVEEVGRESIQVVDDGVGHVVEFGSGVGVRNADRAKAGCAGGHEPPL